MTGASRRRRFPRFAADPGKGCTSTEDLIEVTTSDGVGNSSTTTVAFIYNP